MEWIQTTFYWYVVLFLIGLIFFPITNKIFGKHFIDLGYGFSKIIGILTLCYVVFILGILRILPFTQMGLLFLLFIFLGINIYIFIKEKPKFTPQSILLIIIEEGLFLIGLYFWTFIRGQEPSVRGLEKFMDFGFMNSILRTQYFPPLDIWLSADPTKPTGYPINYYYFGHLFGALLIKLTNIKPATGYNLILSTIFALGIVQVFSIVINLIYSYLIFIKKVIIKIFDLPKIIFYGILGSFIVNLGGNLHTIYLFTKGYPNESPIPFWPILSWYNPTKYWYPNATRFIPFTIHEFPSYSWVVADLHGHVFDIPFVLLTLAILFLFLIKNKYSKIAQITNHQLLITISLGFMTAIHYMTNAFDGPIYILLISLIFLLIFGLSKKFIINTLVLGISFVVFSFPFSYFFAPFVSGIGVNCSPKFLTDIGKLGPFLFEKGNCQSSPPWMMFVLWGFFIINFLIFLFINFWKKRTSYLSYFIFILFSFGIFLIIIPEFFYIKDIYPAHFRANTMFKLGYQAFIMMGIASTFTFFQIKLLSKKLAIIGTVIFSFFFFFIAIYPFFSIPSYYGTLQKPVELDGAKWLSTYFPEDLEIINYFNREVTNQPIILEAQGDSYTDYERISAYTGLPTVAGWWVHEWLWRGSADVVGKRIPDIVNMYESRDINLTKSLLKKYRVQYIIVSKMEKTKYPKLYESKFTQIGKQIFKTTDGSGAIYQLNIL